MNAPKHSILSALRSLLLAAPFALGACDDGAAPDPATDAAAWFAHHLEIVQELEPEAQARHFAEQGDDLELAREHLPAPVDAAEFDLAIDLDPSALAPDVTCDIWGGCVSWNSEQGCIASTICYACTDGRWNCLAT